MTISIAEKIQQIITEGIGSGSMCWVGMESSGLEFDSAQATRVAERVASDILGLLDPSAPDVPGWYLAESGSNNLMFLLNGNLDWYVVTASGDMTKCVYSYVEQCGELMLVGGLDGYGPAFGRITEGPLGAIISSERVRKLPGKAPSA